MQLPPVIAAPMAGGPSTPELVGAVSFGFLAWGTCSPEQAREELARVARPFGINLFYPQDFRPAPAELERVAKMTGSQVPDADLTCGFQTKFALALASGAEVISATFGCFTEEEIDAIHAAGAEAWVTVTNERDAATARGRGADAVVVQGPLAGGHRGTWSPAEEPDERSLAELLAAIPGRTIAAGGVRDKAGVEKLLKRAEAVACGTAFLLADEAGTSERNRELLRGRGASVASRAFTGRVARGIETEFSRAHPDMPPVYPYLRPMVVGRADCDYCLVGADRGELAEGPAAGIERALTL